MCKSNRQFIDYVLALSAGLSAYYAVIISCNFTSYIQTSIINTKVTLPVCYSYKTKSLIELWYSNRLDLDERRRLP